MSELNELDDAIRKALSAEDARVFEQFSREQALHRQVFATFQGTNRWINALGWIAGLVLFVLGCYFWSRFARAEEVRHMILWASCAAVAFLGLGLIKVWFWLELQKNAIVREIKRVELQVASLAARIR